MLKHHPLHTALVHFPIAFLTCASICDLASLMGWRAAWPPSYPLLALGVATGLIAMLAGLPELAKLKDDKSAEQAANIHMSLMGGAWCLYLTALLLRNDNMEIVNSPHIIAISSSLAGFLLLTLGGWFGGKLVYYHGVSVRTARSETDT